MPATKPFVMVGLSASSRSSVSPASAALEHISVARRAGVARIANAIPADPEERRIAEQPVVGGQAADVVENLLVFEQRRMGVHHSLRGGGGTRRVHDGQGVRWVDVVLHRLEQRHVDGVGRSASMRTWRSRRDCRSVDVRQPVAVVVIAVGSRGKQDLDVGVGELGRHLGCGGERRERHDHRADARHGQHRDDPLRPVRVEQADVTALACAEGDQTAGELGRAAVGVGVAEAVGVADQQRMRAPRCCLPSK